MRKRLFEISAVLAGVAIVVVIYFYREGLAGGEKPPEPQPVATIPEARSPTPAPEINRSVPQSSSAARTAAPVSESALPVVEEAELEAARSLWQSAVAELEAVETELDVLDTRFDAKEAELLEMEAQGMDPDTLEEEMLIFLDGIVDEYDLLETRLAEAEAAEVDAAERLAELQGDDPRP